MMTSLATLTTNEAWQIRRRPLRGQYSTLWPGRPFSCYFCRRWEASSNQRGSRPTKLRSSALYKANQKLACVAHPCAKANESETSITHADKEHLQPKLFGFCEVSVPSLALLQTSGSFDSHVALCTMSVGSLWRHEEFEVHFLVLSLLWARAFTQYVHLTQIWGETYRMIYLSDYLSTDCGKALWTGALKAILWFLSTSGFTQGL